MKQLVVAITGASGAIFGIRFLEVLAGAGIESHVIVSKWGQQTAAHETGKDLDAIRDLAHTYYAPGDFGAAISSGSFKTDGMVIVPCSMRTLAAIAHGISDNLIHRAAEVTLKEGRKLVLVPRETPLTEIHLENMLKLSRMGIVIAPPMPAFYNHPQSIGDIVEHTASRLLDLCGIDYAYGGRWDGDLRSQNRVVQLKPKDDL